VPSILVLTKPLERSVAIARATETYSERAGARSYAGRAFRFGMSPAANAARLSSDDSSP
jgi:hypothetical protein